jgi:membrane carboxypeptidase/penicillin-binding protein
MGKVLPETTAADFVKPETVTLVRMDVRSGLLANGDCKDAAEAAFIEGTEPTKHCPGSGEGQLEKFY